MTKELPRDQELPLFDPHAPTFSCEVEMTKVPAIDAQAELWFLQARALEDAEAYMNDLDYVRIVQLTRQAAERHHWKAMLNLASLYLEGHDPQYGVEHAVLLVEKAMQMGIPAAYDRMGTYYMNGTGVKPDASTAYAFWQKAAQMGDPVAMTFLAKKLTATWDSPKDGFWANIPIAKKMLECAMGQGYGVAAYHLALEYSIPPGGQPTREDKTHALNLLHEGVKLGCMECARKLSIEFEGSFDLAKMLAPHIDIARSERYVVLYNALSFKPSRRFPNLDKVLPLPPVELPPWNGDKYTLIDAAIGVAPPAAVPKPTATAQRKGRNFLDAAFELHQTAQLTTEPRAPLGGYWQPVCARQPESVQKQLADILPALYQQGEEFKRFRINEDELFGAVAQIEWLYWRTVRHDLNAVRPHAATGLVREVTRPEPLLSRPGNAICPVTGTWQPWLPYEHPLQAAVNQYWRQTWLLAGQVFPQPERDWPLMLPSRDVTWHLMDATPVDLLNESATSAPTEPAA